VPFETESFSGQLLFLVNTSSLGIVNDDNEYLQVS
jgi:hypothetical protein